MSDGTYQHNRQKLSQLMQRAGISSLAELSQVSGVSERQLTRLQYGLLPKLRVEILLQLGGALGLPLTQLLEEFCPHSLLPSPPLPEPSAREEALRQECQRLQGQLVQQQDHLRQEFQDSSLEVLESWLLQWPTAAVVAQKNPELPAARLLPLVNPVLDLVRGWGIEAIASVGEEVPYDPQCHQLLEGAAEPGEPVKVRYVGYRQGDKLLYRAKVSPISFS